MKFSKGFIKFFSKGRKPLGGGLVEEIDFTRLKHLFLDFLIKVNFNLIIKDHVDTKFI